MRRRAFVALMGGAAGFRPLGARAQQRRLAILQPQRDTDPEAQSWVAAFREGLAALGWREGDLRIDERWYGGNLDRLRAQAAELARVKPDVIFCMSTPTVAALKRATSGIPIVFVNANDPVGSGFVASLARPGGSITGFTAFEPSIAEKWLEMLREMAPQVARIGLVYNPSTHTGQHFATFEAAERALPIRIKRLPFADAAEIDRDIDAFALEPRGGLIIMPDASARVHRYLIVRLAAHHRLPAVYPYRLFVSAGGLAYYGSNTADQFRKAAGYVDRILRGESPATLPVQAPTRFELVLNLTTAKTLGLTIPQSLLTRADELVE